MPDTPHSFFTITAFLKVFLAEKELDKAFTGGLSSFRLYVMVTHVLMKMKKALDSKPQRGGARGTPTFVYHGVSLAAVLLKFFRYYKNPSRLNPSTELRVHLPAPSSLSLLSSSSSTSSSSSSSSSLSNGRRTNQEGMVMVETSFAFIKQVQACQEAFSAAYEVLLADCRWWRQGGPTNLRRQGPNARVPLPSFLGRLVSQ